jgi:hypothetical protein
MEISWTTVQSSLNTARWSFCWCRNMQTAALAFTGSPMEPGAGAATEEWTGSGVATTKTVTVS